MKNIYAGDPQNSPRIKTDKLFFDKGAKLSFRGFIDKAFRYIEDFQLLSPSLWERFVRQFIEDDADFNSGWRGEYWGKMMRGATFVYSYTKNGELYSILEKTVLDMMGAADPSGRISSYAVHHELEAWDLWARKYVLLGMQYFIEICPDKAMIRRIVESMCRQADYIIERVGPRSEGKKPISSCTGHWRGLNSSSILEPIVRLYSLTGERRYFDFAEYIVNEGAMDVVSLFELAYKNELAPYQYPVTKAYEMTSCFEGLLEFYRITGEEKYKIAVINFAERVLETDFTVIGSAGCTHELFDHSTVRQANTTNGKIAQETCVTVTLMKFFAQLSALTADPKYADAFEISLYNAYLGAVNTERVIEPMIKEKHPDWVLEPLPFDSYSPLTAGTRGNGVGGLQVMSDKHYYGCCACIGSAGIGLIPRLQLMRSRRGFAMNLYIDGEVSTETPRGGSIVIKTETDYPKSGEVRIILELSEPEKFELSFRNPAWSEKTEVRVLGEPINAELGYISISREWKSGDEISLSFDMRTRAILPIPYGEEVLMTGEANIPNCLIPKLDREDPIAHRHIAFRRGPVMLAMENRLGYSVDDPIDPELLPDGSVSAELSDEKIAPYPAIVECRIPLADGRKITLTDYASAGKLWTEESKMAVWLLTE